MSVSCLHRGDYNNAHLNGSTQLSPIRLSMIQSYIQLYLMAYPLSFHNKLLLISAIFSFNSYNCYKQHRCHHGTYMGCQVPDLENQESQPPSIRFCQQLNSEYKYWQNFEHIENWRDFVYTIYGSLCKTLENTGKACKLVKNGNIKFYFESKRTA